jgi:outer membrane protein OmpA-like peptidoglycan-associated protein
MRKCMIGIVLTAALVLALSAAPVLSQKVQEHPIIKAFPGFTFDPEESEYKDFNAYSFRVYNPKTDDIDLKQVKGKYWRLYYAAYDSEGNRREDISQFEVAENFKNAALEKGGTILFDDTESGNLSFNIPLENGNTLWGFLEVAWSGEYYITLVEEKGMEQKVTFGADEWKKELDAKGRVAVYGILFDTDKAALKLEAIKPLGEMAKLMLSYPDLRIEIEGHTDSTGTPEHNLDLSQRRADTVKSFLALFGIDAARMTTKGYGQTKPVDTNDTEEGRARNRRVELVKK